MEAAHHVSMLSDQVHAMVCVVNGMPFACQRHAAGARSMPCAICRTLSVQGVHVSLTVNLKQSTQPLQQQYIRYLFQQLFHRALILTGLLCGLLHSLSIRILLAKLIRI